MKTKLLLTSLLAGISFAGFAQWSSQANIGFNTGQEAAVAHPNGNIYLIGGYNLSTAFDSTLIFNQAGNSWSSGAPIPNPTRGPAYALGKDSMIYVFSGYNNLGYDDSSYKYNPKTNKWTSIAKIPTHVWYGAAATANNGKIIVFGGENGMSLVQIYDPTLNSWSSGTALPTPVKEEGALAAGNGKIYVIGGINNSGTAIDSVQVYDPVLDSWGRGKPMPTSRNEFAYIVDDVNGMLFCIGGKITNGNNSAPFFSVVESYDIYSDNWTTGTPIPHGLGETAGASINNGINVFGGSDSATTYSTHNYRMDILPNSTNNLSNDEQFNVYPNPTSGKVTLWLASTNTENVTVRIMDITGQVLYTNAYNNLSGQKFVDMNLAGFSKGVYFIQYNSGKTNMVKKLILQ